MSPIVAGWAAQTAICRALGIDPNVTEQVVLEMPTHGVVRARITQFVTAEQESALERVFALTDWTETEPQ